MKTIFETVNAELTVYYDEKTDHYIFTSETPVSLTDGQMEELVLGLAQIRHIIRTRLGKNQGRGA